MIGISQFQVFYDATKSPAFKIASLTLYNNKK